MHAGTFNMLVYNDTTLVDNDIMPAGNDTLLDDNDIMPAGNDTLLGDNDIMPAWNDKMRAGSFNCLAP